MDMREWHQGEPREEQAGADVRLEEQPEVVELVLPAAAGVPGGMASNRAAGGGCAVAGSAEAVAPGGVRCPRAAKSALCT